MKQHLYVGNLPLTLTEQALEELFGSDGRTVESVTIRKRAKTGKSRGFGFVKMASEEDAERAVAALHGIELDGRTVKVGEAYRETRDKPTSSSYDDTRPMGRPRGGRR